MAKAEPLVLFFAIVVPSIVVAFVASLFDSEHTVYLLAMVSRLYFGITYISWIWSVGITLNRLISPRYRMGRGLFQAAILIAVIYVFGLSVSIQVIVEDGVGPLGLRIIKFAHILATACMFYGFHFVSSNLVAVEREMGLRGGGFFKTFAAILFFPIGLWFVQPRVNTVVYTGDVSQGVSG